MRRPWIVLACLLACTPRPDPIGVRYAGPGGPGQVGAGTATCTATLDCYRQCQLGQECLAACDARATPEGVQKSRAVMTCVLQSGCQDEGCLDQRCAAPLDACGAASVVAGGATTPTAVIDLSYRVPAGWTEQRTADANRLTFHAETPQVKTLDYQLVVLPSRPWQGSPAAAYRALWQETIASGGFVTQMVPSPQRRRLRTGYALLFDGEQMATKAGVDFVLVVYAVVARDRIVPVVGLFQGVWQQDDALEQVLVPWFDALAVRGGQPTSETLFDTTELVGEWVSGDASMTRETWKLAGDGTFTSTFAGSSAGRTAASASSGTWLIDDATLTILDKTGRRTRRRIWGVGVSPSGPASIRLAPAGSGEQEVTLSNPRVRGSGGWYLSL